MVLVKKEIVINPAFRSALQKVYGQETKLEVSYAVLKLTKAYDAEYAEIINACKKYTESEDGKQQIEAFLKTDIELPPLPKKLIEEPSLNLSAQDLFFLEKLIPE